MWSVQLQRLPRSTAVVHTFELSEGDGKGVNVGRSASKSQIVVDSHYKATSRCHAMLVALPAAGGVILQDHGAMNGCFVNDVRVARVVLADGDILTFGSTEVDAANTAMNSRLPAGATAADTAMFTFSAARATPPAPAAAAVAISAAKRPAAAKEEVLDKWACPLCRSKFSSVLIKTAKRWIEEERQCPKCPPSVARSGSPPAAKRQRVKGAPASKLVDTRVAGKQDTAESRVGSAGTAVLSDWSGVQSQSSWAEDEARAGAAVWRQLDAAVGVWNGVKRPVSTHDPATEASTACRGCGTVGGCGSRWLADEAYAEYLKLAEPVIGRSMEGGHGCYSEAMLTAEALRVLLEHEHCATAAIRHLQSGQYQVQPWLRQFEGWSSCVAASLLYIQSHLPLGQRQIARPQLKFPLRPPPGHRLPRQPSSWR